MKFHGMARRATLKEVAELSGVSVISVSRVMRDAPNVSPELRARVEAAAQKLGYTPNRIAGSLRARTSDLIAVIVPSMSNSVFAEVIDGLDHGLSDSRYRTVLGISHYDKAREQDILSDLLSWNPAAVIIAGLEHSDGARELLLGCPCPVLQIMDTDGEPIDLCVGTSQAEAGRMMARHLVERGRRRIGYVGAWGERPVRSRKRRLAFEAELEALSVPLLARHIEDEASSVAVGRRGAEALLAAHPELDAIFFANDDLALGALFHCLETGIAVPDRLALGGFNGLELAQAVSPRLTTIENPRYTMGQSAAALLLDRLRSRDDAPRICSLPLVLRQGQTT